MYLKNEDFCIKNEEFCDKTRIFVLTTRSFVLKLMNFPAADVMGRLRAKLDSSGEQTKAVVTEYDTESLGLIER